MEVQKQTEDGLREDVEIAARKKKGEDGEKGDRLDGEEKKKEQNAWEI